MRDKGWMGLAKPEKNVKGAGRVKKKQVAVSGMSHALSRAKSDGKKKVFTVAGET